MRKERQGNINYWRDLPSDPAGPPFADGVNWSRRKLGGRKPETQYPRLAEEAAANGTLSQILFDGLPATTLNNRGFPPKLVDHWGKQIASGKLPNEFGSLEEMIEVCTDVFNDKNKRFDKNGKRLW